MDAKRTAIHFELKKVEFHFVNEKHEEKKSTLSFSSHHIGTMEEKRSNEIERQPQKQQQQQQR